MEFHCINSSSLPFYLLIITDSFNWLSHGKDLTDHPLIISVNNKKLKTVNGKLIFQCYYVSQISRSSFFRCFRFDFHGAYLSTVFIPQIKLFLILSIPLVHTASLGSSPAALKTALP